MKSKIANQILGFLLCFTLVIFCLVLILVNTILNKEFMIDVMTKVNYDNKVYNNIIDIFENNLMSTNLELELEDIVNLTMVKEDILAVVDYMYSGGTLNISGAAIKENLIKAEEKALDGIYLDKENKEYLEKLENNLVNIYQEEILINYNILNTLHNFIGTIRGILLATLVILLLIMLNIGAILKKIFKKSISSSVTASGLVLGVCFILLNKRFQDILLINPAFSELLKNIFESISKMLLGCFAILLSLGIALIILQTVKTNSSD